MKTGNVIAVVCLGLAGMILFSRSFQKQCDRALAAIAPKLAERYTFQNAEPVVHEANGQSDQFADHYEIDRM